MMNYTIDTITTKEGAQKLYNDSAFTFVGLNVDDQNIQSLLSFLNDEEVLNDKITTLSVVSGKTMNEQYELTGTNEYPEDLNLVAIEFTYLKNISQLALLRLRVGAKWFDNLVDNNRRREK